MKPILLLLVLTAACSGEEKMAGEAESVEAPAEVAAPAEALDPPSPGQAGALPDDRGPISEAPFTPESAQGAADVLQTYYALIEEGDYESAWRLRAPGGNGKNFAEFAAGFDKYAEHHALIGAPSDISGAAGSLYVEVPVQTYGKLQDGTPFSSAGTVTMRRSNDVPGATAEQRRWRIHTR